MDDVLAQFVRDRAGNACEYCRVPQIYYLTIPFPIDHITARQHGGKTVASNLALSCLHDNSYKGPNIAGIDPLTRKITRLFHPRRHRWRKHFRWNGPYIIGRTAIGRTTVMVLNMNLPDAVAVRAALIAEGVFPPDEF